jgi:hypothetical protein
MEAHNPFDRIDKSILYVILGFVTHRHIVRAVCKSWRDVLPKPSPLPDLRDFGSPNWLSQSKNFVQSCDYILNRTFDGVFVRSYAYYACGGATCADKKAHVALNLLVDVFRVCLEDLCSRSLYYPRKQKSDRVLVYSQQKWSWHPILSVARVIFSAVAEVLNDFANSDIHFDYRFASQLALRWYREDPEWYASHGALLVMSIAGNAYPVTTDEINCRAHSVCLGL